MRDDELALVPAASAVLGAVLEQGKARARSYADAARAANTRRAYDSQWRPFVAWCRDRSRRALPAEGATVAIYLAELADAGRATAGISVVLTAISQAHKLAGEISPREAAAVVEVWKGIRRTLGTAQHGKAPMLLDAVAAAAAALPATLTGLRDRALLLLGFCGAFRRSELVGLAVDDLCFSSRGVVVTLRRSKTDQAGAGRDVPIPSSSAPSCPVRALQAWLAASGITAGPVFRPINRWGKVAGEQLAAHHVARLVKACAATAGLDPDLFAGHSLRAGFATTAAGRGATERQIMLTTGHRSVQTVLRYIRPTQVFEGLADVGERGPTEDR